MINKLTSEFNKFKDFGIDLNDANKTTTKVELTTKKAEKTVKKGEQDIYDLNKDERDKTRKETKDKLLTERKQRKQVNQNVKKANSMFGFYKRRKR